MLRLRTPIRPSHPAPNVRDDREAPLLSGQDAGISGVDLPDGTSKIFFCEGLDMNSSNLPDGQISSAK
jgi:hypothetical protein